MIGFLCCWVVVSLLVTAGDYFGWYDAEWFKSLLIAPILAVLAPAVALYLILLRPWRHVWRPVERKRFDYMAGLSKGRQLRVLPRFYVCYDPSAKSALNRVFFVRIKKEATP